MELIGEFGPCLTKHVGPPRQRRSQDFFWGGATRYNFVTSPGADRIQWGEGGGVVAEICSSRNFPRSQLPDRIGFSGGGGGVVAEIFPG